MLMLGLKYYIFFALIVGNIANCFYEVVLSFEDSVIEIYWRCSLSDE